MKDYFAILEIGSNSTESDIRKAYRRLVERNHPDINKAENSDEKFIGISEAEVAQKFNDGYKVYNDVTIISVFYPLFKFIFR